MASQNEDLMEKSSGLRTGRWCNEEDDLLRACVLRYGEGNWHLIPQRSGLKRCRKSCRLRWLNYLKPDIKRGDFSEDEIDMMIRLHKLLGNRWSLIAGRLPGRTANGVKNYWNTHMRERGRHCHGSCQLAEKSEETSMRSHTPITVTKPQAFRFSSRSSSSSWWRENIAGGDEVVISEENSRSRRGPDEGQNQQEVDDKSMEWWKCFDDNDTIGSSSSKSSSMSMTEQEGTFHQLWDQQLSWTDGDFPFLHTSLSDFLA